MAQRLRKVGRFFEAVELLEEYWKSLGPNEREQRIACLNEQSQSLWRQGKLAEGKTKAHKALLLAQKEPHDLQGQISALRNLGSISLKQDELKYAEGFLQRALDLGKELSDARSMTITLNGLGVVHRRQGKLDRAATCFKHSLALAEELKDREYVARVLYNLGFVYWQQGKLKDAKTYYQRCLPLFEEFGILEEGAVKTLEELFTRGEMDEEDQEDLEPVIKGLSKLAQQLEK
jgi:tetratricopeptide (TPR) repeat protein